MAAQHVQGGEETPFTYRSAADFDCEPNRGGTDKSLLVVNHWIQPGGLPDPVVADRTNSAATITKRFEDCIATRHKLPMRSR